MTAKIAPARRAAFFGALEATGNYAVAAARVKVSRGWVHLHKRQDQGFAVQCRAAVAAAATRLCRRESACNALGANAPARGARHRQAARPLAHDAAVPRKGAGSILRKVDAVRRAQAAGLIHD